MKKGICILIMLALLLTILPIGALAAGEVTIGSIEDKHRGESVTISGTTIFDEVSIKVLYPNGDQYNIETVQSSGGSYSYTFRLASDIPYGIYMVVAGRENKVANTAFEVKEQPASTDTDAQKVALDKAALTSDVIKGLNSGLDNVITNLNLVTAVPGGAGSAISWSSGKTNVISTDGKVTRPSERDTEVTLTATISSGAKSDTKRFTVIVRQEAVMYTAVIQAGTGGRITAGTGGSYTPGTVISIEAEANRGYAFSHWSSNTGSFADANSATTTFTMPAASVTITAEFTYTGGGGTALPAAPTPTPLPIREAVSKISLRKGDGSASEIDVTVKVNAVTGNAEVNLKELEGDIFAGGEVPVIALPAIPGANSYTLGISGDRLTGSGKEALLTFSTEAGSITIPGNMLEGLSEAEGKETGITIGQGDKSALPEEVRKAIGERPVVQLALTVDGEQIRWNNPGAPVSVSVPYTPTTEELSNSEYIVVWYIDGKGNAVPVPSGRYDPAAGTVTFTVSHFSYYAVTYVHKTFGDLGGAEWARKAIEVLASKGIIEGSGGNAYSPAANITRADYLTLLVRTLELTAEIDGSFDDVKPGDYYYDAASIAKKLGIAGGVGDNRFNPKENISRQDMMVLTARALKLYGELKAEEDTAVLGQFADGEDIAGYAAGSIAALVEEGLIIGDVRRIKPMGNTTRAEAAIFLYRIYNKYS